MSLGADYTLSDHITAETFVKAIKNSDKFDERYSMLTWLCSIAKNVYFDYLKKKDNTFISLDEQLVFYYADLESDVENSEQKIMIHKSIIKLDSPYKEVIYLRIFADLSFKEIGEILSKNENWARVTFYRGKIRLKELLENEI